MSSSASQSVRAVLIPWVFAVVALFGLNALAPDRSLVKKSDSSDEIGLSQTAHNIQAPGRIFNPLVFLADDPSDGIGLLHSSSEFLCIEFRRDFPLVRSLRGEVQGRAPPTGALFRM